MKAAFIVALLALVCAATADPTYSTCSTSNMTSVFSISSISMSPANPTTADTVVFSIAGTLAEAASDVQAYITTSYCIGSACLALDSRTLSCSNDSCDFAAGDATIQVSQSLSAAFAGSFKAVVDLEGTVDGSSVTFGCASVSFQITSSA